MQVDIQALKAAVGYDPDSVNSAFASKWAEQLDDETVELVELFVASRIASGKGKKGAASYKSLILRYLVTGEWSKGKSGDSQKSAVRSFIRFAEQFASEVDQDDELEIEETEELEV